MGEQEYDDDMCGEEYVDDDRIYANARQKVQLKDTAGSAMVVDLDFTGWGHKRDSALQQEAGLMVSTVTRTAPLCVFSRI
jgi:hypothetical protein